MSKRAKQRIGGEMIVRTFFRVFLFAGSALGLVGLTPVPAHSTAYIPNDPPSTAWYADAVGDSTVAEVDITGWSVTRHNAGFVLHISVAELRVDTGYNTPIRWGANAVPTAQGLTNTFVAERTSGGIVEQNGDCASAEINAPRRQYIVYFSFRCFPGDAELKPFVSLLSHNDTADVPPTRAGYTMVTASGELHSFGLANGGTRSPSGSSASVDIEPIGVGYLLLDSAGYVTPRSSALYTPPVPLAAGERAVSISATPTGNGYWVFTDKGRVIPFGDAKWVGDMSGVALNGPVLDSIATPNGNGYLMVGEDGGIFNFSDQPFLGSLGNNPPPSPVVAVTAVG